MRMLMKVSMCTDAGNAAIKAGTMGETVDRILKDCKAEAAYFYAENGMRTGMIIVDLKDPSGIPALAEPWFLAFNAKIEIQPVMQLADFVKAGPSIAAAVKKYG